MDNQKNPFFTAGVGNDQADSVTKNITKTDNFSNPNYLNSLDGSGNSDNLNSDNWTEKEKTAGLVETLNSQESSHLDRISQRPEQEQITSEITIPPSEKPQNQSGEISEITPSSGIANTKDAVAKAPGSSTVPVLDLSQIRTNGDRLAKGSLKAAKQAEERLNATDDADNFYAAARGATRANLKNSFNRKLAA